MTLSRYALRIRMVALFLTAVGIMIIHHSFYQALDKKAANSNFFAKPSLSHLNHFITEYYGSIGNALSILAKAALCGSLAIVFVQVFWYQHKHGRYSIHHIDKVVLGKDDPLTSILSLGSMKTLSAITLLGVSMVVITIFAPGALRPLLATIARPCTVQTVDLDIFTSALFGETNMDGTYGRSASQLTNFVGQVLYSGSYLPPATQRDPYNASTTYMISFPAPSFNCTDITGSFNFSQFDNNVILPQSVDPQSVDAALIWNATVSKSTDNVLSLTVAARKLKFAFPSELSSVIFQSLGYEPDPSPSAVQCTAVQAQYNVTVHTGTGDGAIPYLEWIVWWPIPSPINGSATEATDTTGLNYVALADSVMSSLNGTIYFDLFYSDFTPNSGRLAYSPFGAADPTSPWSWKGGLADDLSMMAQSVIVSILSGRLAAMSGGKPLSNVDTVCEDENLYYIYRPLRLFLSYGVALFVTALCIVLGFFAIHANGEEESFVISDILRRLPGYALVPVDDSDLEGKSPSPFYSP